jgi:hypothetical protein
MIHNSRVFGYECSPDKAIRIITPELLEKIKKNIRDFFVAMCRDENYNNPPRVKELIKQYKLNKEIIVDEYTTSYCIKSR